MSFDPDPPHCEVVILLEIIIVSKLHKSLQNTHTHRRTQLFTVKNVSACLLGRDVQEVIQPVGPVA